MATDAQKRQRKLFLQKGSISIVCAIVKSLSTDESFSKGFRDRCSIISWYAEKLKSSFNKEVGWEEK